MNASAMPAPTTPAQPVLRQIRASAGSGKTYTLTTSFLEHLATASGAEGTGCRVTPAGAGGEAPVYSWADILAVTFTNRAAAEMRERIIMRLKLAVLGKLEAHDPLLHTAQPWTRARAATWLEHILRHFGRLNVRTIDSLVHQLVRMGALDLDLPPDFTPEFVTGDALAPLLDTLLEEARHAPAFAALLEAACWRQLVHSPDFRGFLNGRVLRERVLETVPLLLGLAPEKEARLADADSLGQRLAALTQAVRTRAELVSDSLTHEHLKVRVHLLTALEKCRTAPDHQLPPDSTMLAKGCLADCLLKASAPPSEKAESLYIALREAVEALKGEGQLLRSALRTMPFLELARVLTHALPGYFQAEGRIPAMLLNPMAERLLADDMGVSRAFCRMGANLTHLLIDEFQDTSREQWNVLRPLVAEALARGGSLTFVGDVKQAIYGWRGGDAALFDDILADPELLALVSAAQTDTLPTNWRSRGVIVQSNNRIFAQLAETGPAKAVLRCLLPEATPEAVLDAATARVQNAFAASGQLERGKKGGCVRFVRLEGDTVDELNANVREALLTLMDDLQSRHPRRLWGDVAVLVRSNREAERAAGWLMEHGVPVVTENSFLLADHPLIRQIMAVLTVLDSPENDIALWSAVTSELARPLIELDPADLDDWLMSLPAKRNEPLHRLFKRDFPEAHARVFAPFSERACLFSPYDTVRELLRLCGAEQRFPEETAFVRRFLEVIYRAELQGATTLARLVTYWNDAGAAEKAPMPESLDAVRIMTLHKAKGLQFPVVIVPWHSFTPRQDSAPRVLDVPPMVLVAPPSAALGHVHYEELADQAREALHLIYVAWTRPEDELYAFITRSPRASRMADALDVLLADEPFRGTVCQKGDAVEGKTPARIADSPDRTPETPVAVAPVAVATAETPDVPASPLALMPPMSWLPRLRIHRAPLERLAASPKRRGSFVHHCLACLCITGNPRADAERAVERGLRTFPVLLRAPEMVAEDITASLAWYAALPAAPLWAQHGVAEQPLIDEDGSLLRADRVVSTDHEVTVVEYKTGLPHPDHARQINAYMRLLAAAQPLPVRGALVYLDQQRLEAVDCA